MPLKHTPPYFKSDVLMLCNVHTVCTQCTKLCTVFCTVNSDAMLSTTKAHDKLCPPLCAYKVINHDKKSRQILICRYSAKTLC